MEKVDFDAIRENISSLLKSFELVNETLSELDATDAINQEHLEHLNKSIERLEITSEEIQNLAAIEFYKFIDQTNYQR